MITLFRNPFARAIRAFPRAEHGNVAIMFAFALVPIIGLVGAAVDYSRANSARSALQSALDATALMISREAAGLTEDQIKTRAQGYFDALYNSDASIKPLDIVYTPNSGNGATVAVKASGSLPTTFMKVAGFPTIDFGSSTSTKWGASRMRVALALDNTLSMASSSKMDKLKTAANDLLTALEAMATREGDVYVSVVPFNVMVKVDPSNVTADWIDWTAWDAEPPFTKPSNWSNIGPGSSCPFTSKDHGFTCTDRPATASSARSASSIPSSGTYAGYICPSVDGGNRSGTRRGIFYNGCYDSVATTTQTITTVSSGRNASCGNRDNCKCEGSGSSKVCNQTTTTTGAPYTHNWVRNDRSTWNGCIADRNQDYDTNADPPTTAATLFPAMQYKDCPVALTPLSFDWEGLAAKVEAMQPVGYTNQSIGMAWGWLSLLQQKPLDAPAKEANYQYTNVVILLSDGDNTQNRFSTSASAIDARQKILCDNAKARDPITGKPPIDEIFTIQVNTDGTATSSVMAYCASEPKAKHAFTTTTASGISAAFGQIATQLSMLRIAK